LFDSPLPQQADLTIDLHVRITAGFRLHVTLDVWRHPSFAGTSDEDLGTHCFQYVRPEFRERVKQGQDIIVAGAGFGSGSSREEAVRAIKGYACQ
jgi:hypothetical protein